MEQPRRGLTSLLPHVVLVDWVVGMLAFAYLRPDAYSRAMQEDAFVEWLTVFLFLSAAVASFVVRKAHRRFGDLMIALFCLFAAGEEISWGQRIYAFVPSETFLTRNAQQEANFHNLVEAFGQPKWSLIAILFAYGIVLPLFARIPATRRLLERTRTTAPNLSVAAWFAITIVIEIIYPVRFTGEWAEAMAGGLFLWGIADTSRFTAVATALSALLGAGATALSNRTSATDDVRTECARVETAYIHGALTELGYPSERGRGMNRRLGTMWPTGRVDRVIRSSLQRLTCPAESAERRARRHAFGIDPWGNAYWVRIERDTSGSARLRVYSFGANRRRDHDHIGGAVGDDVVADSATRR